MGSERKEKMAGFTLDAGREGARSVTAHSEDGPPATVADHREWLLFGAQYMFMEHRNALKSLFIF